MRFFLFALSFLALVWGCSSETSSDADTNAQPDVVTDGVEPAPDTVMDVPADRAPETAHPDVVETDDAQDVAEEVQPEGPLPFVLEPRPDVGEPMTEQELADNTHATTAFFKDAAFFDWIWWTSHGLDASHDPELFHYKLYWQDTQSIKEGDTIRMVHTGGADNLALRTAKVLLNACALYLATGDMQYGRIVEQYSRGFAALSMGLEWSTEEPLVKYLQARAVFTVDHEFEMDGGRKMKVEYGPVKEQIVYSWNAHTIPNDENPHWGPIWVRTMRSKDDVPHMYRVVPWLKRVAANGADDGVREAAELGVEYLSGFAADIVDSGYYIRTKDQDGNTFIPLMEDSEIVNDLASFVNYEELIPGAECAGKLGSALVGYGEALGNDCGTNDHNLYEDIASDGHYFNRAIIRYFHLAAITNALESGENELAQQMLVGAMMRADRLMGGQDLPTENKEWRADLAAWLLAAASSGMPLTSAEARLVAEEYAASAAHYAAWDKWDPWSEAVPDGSFNYKADRNGYAEPGNPESEPRTYIRLTEMSFIFEYCYSPYVAPDAPRVFDCDKVLDPSQWGAE